MGDIGIDALGRRRDLHEIDALIAEIDDALDHAQIAVVGRLHIAFTHAADARLNMLIGKTRQSRGEERARRLDVLFVAVDAGDLPIPA